MGLVPTPKAIIGQYINGRNATDDFLQLATNHGGTVFGWIDSDGHLQGSLLTGIGGGSVTSVFGRTGVVIAQSGDYTVFQITGAAPLASPAFTGNPTVPAGPIAASLPFGVDTGVVNAYVVNPTPPVTLTVGQVSAFNWTTTNTNTGASTINVSGTGVKNLYYNPSGFAALTTGQIKAGVMMECIWDGVAWCVQNNLFGASVPASTFNPGVLGSLSLMSGSSTSGTGASTLLTLSTFHPVPTTQTLLQLNQSGTQNRLFFDADSDGSWVIRGTLVTVAVPTTWFNLIQVQNGAISGPDILINPGVTKASGTAITVQHNSGPVLFSIDSLTGTVTTSGDLISSQTSPATNIANFSSGNVKFIGNYWTGSASAQDVWSIQNVLSAGTNPSTTLTFAHTGSLGNLLVSMPALNVSGSLTGLVISSQSSVTASTDVISLQTSPATGIANFNSGKLTAIGNYWTGAASAQDTWSIQDVLGTGSNPTSTLTIAHTGSSGAATVQAPNLVITGATPTGTSTQLSFGNTTATSANAGSNGDVPAQVVGYLVWDLGGVSIKIPYYAT